MAMHSAPIPDMPVPFGYKVLWYAVASTDTKKVISALGLNKPRPSTWSQGVAAAYEGKIFVTPPIKNWTLAVGTPFGATLDNEPGDFVESELRRLSKHFDEVQFFSSHRVVEAHLWSKAKEGRLVRGYCFVGDRGETTWNFGQPTMGEIEAGFENSDSYFPNEETVMAVAKQWSVNPCEIDQLLTEPSLGTLCDPA